MSPASDDNEVLDRAAARAYARAETSATYLRQRQEAENERQARIELERYRFREQERERHREQHQRPQTDRRSSHTRPGPQERSPSGSSPAAGLSPAQIAELAAEQVQMSRERAATEARERAEALEREELRRASRRSRLTDDVRAAEARVRFLHDQTGGADAREHRHRRPMSVGRIESAAHRPEEYLDLPTSGRRPVTLYHDGGRRGAETLRERGERVIAAEQERARQRELQDRMITGRGWDDVEVRVPVGAGLQRRGSLTGTRESFYTRDRRRWRFSG